MCSGLISLGVAQGASAVGDPPLDLGIPDALSTHFYGLNISRVATTVGSPYVTAFDASTVLTMDWDGELTSTNANTKESQQLGTLALPAQSRLLDFEYFTEKKATAQQIPVFVSYAYVDPTTECRYLVLREASIDRTGSGSNTWGKIWFTSPCFPMVDAERDTYFLNQSGGRMALVPKSERVNPRAVEFMLGVGDFKSMVTPTRMTTAAKKILGTIVHIKKPNQYEVYSRGLRNTQGLIYGTLDGKPAVLATSQGPRGGDELVHATKGANFGWPYRNYGTGYRPGDTVSRPFKEGTKSGYDRPLIAWVPSIGLSAAVQLKGPAFAQWWEPKEKNATHDLIVSGLADRSLYRVRIDQGAARYYEKIPIDARVRSLATLPDGRILVGLDSGGVFLVISPI
jgi:hypothetical protein